MEKITNKKALEFAISQLVAKFDEDYAFNQNCVPGEEKDVEFVSEVVTKLQKMLVQVEKKSGAKSDKPTKAQVENVEIKEKIVATMVEIGKPCQVKEVCAIIGLSNQKVSALMRQLVEVGRVLRVEDKKVTLFSIIDTEEEILEVE